jgi:hypothetical protein
MYVDAACWRSVSRARESVSQASPALPCYYVFCLRVQRRPCEQFGSYLPRYYFLSQTLCVSSACVLALPDLTPPRISPIFPRLTAQDLSHGKAVLRRGRITSGNATPCQNAHSVHITFRIFSQVVLAPIMPPQNRKATAAAEQAKDDRQVVLRLAGLPSYPYEPDTHAPSENSRALRASKQPRTSMAELVNGNRSSLTVEPRVKNALEQIEESLGVLKKEFHTHKQTSGNMVSDLNNATNRTIALEEELRDLRDRERRQRLDSAVKIDDLSLQLTKQKAKAASDLSNAYQEINDCKINAHSTSAMSNRRNCKS